MYLSKSIIESIYKDLSKIDAGGSDGKGKRAGERVSAVRYFLATCAGIKRHSTNSLSLATSEPQNRKDFIVDVGDVVRLEKHAHNNGQYTSNFKQEISSIAGFGAGNNFLTGSLTKNVNYPGRPTQSELLVIKNYALSLHPQWKPHLSNYGEFPDYAPALALWLIRFDELISDDDSINGYLSRIKQIIKDRYGDAVKEILCNNDDALTSYLQDENGVLRLSNECTEDLTNLIQAKKKQVQEEIQSSTSSDNNGENVIYYGAPGTGKSFKIKEKTAGYTNTQKPRVVFHSEYQNSDFIGSLKPALDGKNITYRFVPGPFTKAFISSFSDPNTPYALIIEEINRANAAAVFGDVFQLLDRDSNGNSEYPVSPDEQLKEFILEEFQKKQPPVDWDGEIILPKNLSILATMNSADQGVLPMDSAFKRRWRFEYVQLDFEHCSAGQVEHSSIQYEWGDFAQAVNKVLIRLNVEEDRLLGPWFLSSSELRAGSKAVAGKLFVYLWDDVLRHLPRNRIFDCEDKSFGDICAAYLEGKSVLSEELLEELRSGELQADERESTEEAAESVVKAVEA